HTRFSRDWSSDVCSSDLKGIKRYGNAFVPMDEALAQVVIDLGNRPHLELKADFPSSRVGTFDTELVHEFLWKLALEARINLHVKIGRASCRERGWMQVVN